MCEKKVVVVGTTPDYIEYISSTYPDRAFFISDSGERTENTGPGPAEELVCDLRIPNRVTALFRERMNKLGFTPSGIACYDCESLELASHIASTLNLPFPSLEAVSSCRNKFHSRQIWHKAGIPCPQAVLIKSLEDAPRFMDKMQSPLIIKPLTGSGSELVFKCSDHKDCLQAFDIIQPRLASHPNTRMYLPGNGSFDNMDARRIFSAETFIPGIEYSCDFIIDYPDIEIIRMTEKIPAEDQSTGTTLAYVIPGVPVGLEIDELGNQFKKAAHSLGLKRAFCMVDFIVHENKAYLIEMTPRPGGDCIPPLIRKSCGLDTIGMLLNFAESLPISIPEASCWEPMAGLRLFAEKQGILKKIDCSALEKDSRVLEYQLKCHTGQMIKLPPEDYDSRILGHVIFKPFSHTDIKSQCADISSKLKIE